MLALSFAFPEQALRPFVPAGLEIDTYAGHGFLTVAMVWTRRMRPLGFPAFCGRDFFLSGYRIFTRLKDESGRRLRGLRILRSETDSLSMVWMGNLMTHYNYRRVNVRRTDDGAELTVESTLGNGERTLRVSVDQRSECGELPEGSPFPDWRSARLFAGPMPFTFSPEAENKFVVIEGSRDTWTPRAVKVNDWAVSLFGEPELRGVTPVLANAFMVENIEYCWKRGRLVRTGTGR